MVADLILRPVPCASAGAGARGGGGGGGPRAQLQYMCQDNKLDSVSDFIFSPQARVHAVVAEAVGLERGYHIVSINQ